MADQDKIPVYEWHQVLADILRGRHPATHMYENLDRVRRQCGDTARVNMVVVPMVHLFGADANAAVLLDRGRLLSAREPWTRIMGGIFPDGLLLMDGERHAHDRRIIGEAFLPAALDSYGDLISRVIRDWLEELPGSGEIIAGYYAFRDLTFRIAVRLLLGVDGSADLKTWNVAFEDMVTASMVNIKLNLPFTAYRRGLRGRALLVKYLQGQVAEKRRRPGEDMFSRLCHVTTPEGDQLSDQQIINHLIFMMMAAHDTTTSTMSFMARGLACFPAWQERLREESLSFGWRPPSFQETQEMSGINLFLKETLRYYPPISVIPRTTMHEWEWQGYRIPGGTVVVISPLYTHFMAEYWSDPLLFDPLRFSPERREDRRHSHCFIPFGGGHHMCLGRLFAAAQITMVFHQLLLNFRLSVPAGTHMPLIQAPIARPADGLPLRLEYIGQERSRRAG